MEHIHLHLNEMAAASSVPSKDLTYQLKRLAFQFSLVHLSEKLKWFFDEEMPMSQTQTFLTKIEEIKMDYNRMMEGSFNKLYSQPDFSKDKHLHMDGLKSALEDLIKDVNEIEQSLLETTINKGEL